MVFCESNPSVIKLTVIAFLFIHNDQTCKWLDELTPYILFKSFFNDYISIPTGVPYNIIIIIYFNIFIVVIITIIANKNVHKESIIL